MKKLIKQLKKSKLGDFVQLDKTGYVSVITKKGVKTPILGRIEELCQKK